MLSLPLSKLTLLVLLQVQQQASLFKGHPQIRTVGDPIRAPSLLPFLYLKPVHVGPLVHLAVEQGAIARPVVASLLGHLGLPTAWIVAPEHARAVAGVL